MGDRLQPPLAYTLLSGELSLCEGSQPRISNRVKVINSNEVCTDQNSRCSQKSTIPQTRQSPEESKPASEYEALIGSQMCHDKTR